MAAVSFRIVRDDVSPALSRMAAAAQRPQPIFRAMGTAFMSITMGNFKNGNYRPVTWPAKRDGSAATLQKSGTLSKSFELRVSNTGATLATTAATKDYAAIHQFGAKDHVAGVVVGQIKTRYANYRFIGSFQNVTQGGKGIPPRPYFPVGSDGRLISKAEEKIRQAGEKAMRRQAAH